MFPLQLDGEKEPIIEGIDGLLDYCSLLCAPPKMDCAHNNIELLPFRVRVSCGMVGQGQAEHFRGMLRVI